MLLLLILEHYFFLDLSVSLFFMIITERRKCVRDPFLKSNFFPVRPPVTPSVFSVCAFHADLMIS